MNAKKLLIGGIVGGIGYFLLGWLLYGNLLLGYFKDHLGPVPDYYRQPPLMEYLIIGNLGMGFLLSYIFVKGRVNYFGSGFIVGGIFGFLFAVANDFISYSTTLLLSRTFILADIATMTIISAITGAIAAMASGSGDIES